MPLATLRLFRCSTPVKRNWVDAAADQAFGMSIQPATVYKNCPTLYRRQSLDRPYSCIKPSKCLMVLHFLFNLLPFPYLRNTPDILPGCLCKSST